MVNSVLSLVISLVDAKDTGREWQTTSSTSPSNIYLEDNRLSYIQNLSFFFFSSIALWICLLVKILIEQKELWGSGLVGLKIYQWIFIECLLCNILPSEHLAKFLCCIICTFCRIEWGEEIKLRNLLLNSICSGCHRIQYQWLQECSPIAWWKERREIMYREWTLAGI